MALAALSEKVFCEDNSKLIFCNLRLFQLARCSEVSRLWLHFVRRFAVSDDELKNAIPGIGRFAQKDIKKYVHDHAVSSEEEVEQRLSEFVSKVSLNQKCTFECFFPFNPVCEIVVEFGYGRCCKTDINPEHTEVCIFLKKPLEKKLRDENLPRIIYGMEKLETLNVSWTLLEDFFKTPCSFIDFRAILYGDWEEQIIEKVKKMWCDRKDELSVQFNLHQALAW